MLSICFYIACLVLTGMQDALYLPQSEVLFRLTDRLPPRPLCDFYGRAESIERDFEFVLSVVAGGEA